MMLNSTRLCTAKQISTLQKDLASYATATNNPYASFSAKVDCLAPVLSYCLADFPMTLLTVPLASSLDFYLSLASIPLYFPKNLLLEIS